MATAYERRMAVRDKYRTILGRNYYNQARRNYCYTKYSDGKYYSDCSSSISHTYKQVGESFGILNTVGMYNSTKLKDVPVIIKSGQITNPEVLRIGDMLLFAGSDTSRKSAGYVGHVEMVGEISGSKVTLYGHGSGRPSKKEMTAYCKTRYNSKSSTPLGRKLLIRVRRFIQDDVVPTTPTDAQDSVTIKRGDYGDGVKALQQQLLKWEPQCLPQYGADGEFGAETESAVRLFQASLGLPITGICDEATRAVLTGTVSKSVRVTANSANVRATPALDGKSVVVVCKPRTLAYAGNTAVDDRGVSWYQVNLDDGKLGWISSKMAELS